MKDGLLRNQPMVLGSRPALKFEPSPVGASSLHPCPLCPSDRPIGQRWGSFSNDGGQTWFCAMHKPEQRP